MNYFWIALFFVGTFCVYVKGDGHKAFTYARCDVVPNPNPSNSPPYNITGYILLKQEDESKIVSYKVSLSGFGSGSGSKHGFHVHTYGSVGEGCENAGGHFNPLNVLHGAKTRGRKNRHIGDLGNIKVDDNGSVMFETTDDVISLRGRKRGIIGRSIMVHAGEDDLGKGGDSGSTSTGNAGSRLACCPIVHSDGSGWD